MKLMTEVAAGVVCAGLIVYGVIMILNAMAM